MASGTGRTDGEKARDALTQLCRIYWRPVLGFILGKGHSLHDAQDLAQDFFMKIISTDFLMQADRERGKFRSLLLTSLQHFLNDAHDSAKTAKRSANLVPMDAIQNEDFQIENTDNWSAENRFDAGWAVTVSQRALDHLREECVRAGREKVFTVLSPFLAIDIDDWNYQKAAEVLGVPGSSTRTLVNRLRERYRSLLRAEVAETVCEPAAIEDELRYLHRLLVGGIA